MTFLEKIIAAKKEEVSQLEKLAKAKKPFTMLLQEKPEQLQLIAEVKRASPSKGDINLDFDPVEQAKAYQRAGAGMISVLTDPTFFKGSFQDLKRVSESVSVPTLCKDFIISELQLRKAKQCGASVVLLIVAALSEIDLNELYHKARQLDLEVLVEVHNEKELVAAHKLGAKLIGINNRNLHTFEVDLAVSERLVVLQQPDRFYISESGIYDEKDIERVKKHYSAVLVGESLMRADNPKAQAEKLKVNRK